MGWNTTADLDKFLTAADAYLRARAAENIDLLVAAHDAREALVGRSAAPGRGRDSLYGWWEPPGGTRPRGAFVHDPDRPLLLAGRAPEIAAALAAPLSRAGRSLSGVDAYTAAADAFAGAWRQRAGVSVQLHRSRHVHRLLNSITENAEYVEYEAPPGRARSATWADRDLVVSWLRALTNEIGDLTAIPEASADDLLGYGGAAFWEADGVPVAMAMVTPPVEGVVQVRTMYAPPRYRGRGYAIAVLMAVCRATMIGRAREIVMVTDGVRPIRRVHRLGFESLGERAVLSFGPPTGPIPRLTGPMSRLTGPIPRLTGPIPRYR